MSDEKFGPTGRFPQGKISPNDEGELRFGVAHDSDGLVHIDFGMPVRALALPPDIAIQFAQLLLRHAGIKKVEIEL